MNSVANKKRENRFFTLYTIQIFFTVALFALLQWFSKKSAKFLYLWSYPIRTPSYLGGLSFNYVGFVAPLLISIILIVDLLKTRPGGSSVARIKVLFLCGISFLTFVAFDLVPQLQQVALTGGLNYIALFILAFFAAPVVVKESGGTAVKISYVMGFIVGSSSDVATSFLTSGIFGGYGLLDGDFTVPVAFLLSTVLFAHLYRKLPR